MLTKEEIKEILQTRYDNLYEVRVLFSSEPELTDEQAITVVKELFRREEDKEYTFVYVVKKKVDITDA